MAGMAPDDVLKRLEENAPDTRGSVWFLDIVPAPKETLPAKRVLVEGSPNVSDTPSRDELSFRKGESPDRDGRLGVLKCDGGADSPASAS